MHCRLRIISYLCNEVARLGCASAIGVNSIALDLHEPCGKLIKLLNITTMAEDLKKQQEKLNDEQLDKVAGGDFRQHFGL